MNYLKKTSFLRYLILFGILSCDKDEFKPLAGETQFSQETVQTSKYTNTGAREGISDESYNGRPELLPINVPNDFIWGMNGHPATQEAFKENVSLQITMLKELNINHYRIDVSLGFQGEMTQEVQTHFENIKSAAKQNAIDLVVVLNGPTGHGNEELMNWTTQQAEDIGYTIGNTFASAYKDDNVHYYELGNELEIPAIMNNASGVAFDHYDSAMMMLISKYLTGMSNGVKAADPSAVTIVNSAGYLHYWYFKILEQYGTPFDVIGYHWYDSIPELNQSLNFFADNFASKDIWITEINKKLGSNGSNAGLQQQFVQLRDYINEFHNRNQVKAIFVYELFDEPSLDDNTGFDAKDYAYLGIAKWTNVALPFAPPYDYTQADWKPAGKLVKYKIEETLYGFEDFAQALYQRCLKREDSGNGVDSWASFLRTNGKSATITNFLRGEYHGLYTDAQFQSLLGRLPDTNERTHWIQQLDQDLPKEQMINLICSGDEFWQLSGSNNNGFIGRIYQKLLGRTAPPEAISYWVGERLAMGTPRSQVVGEIMISDEFTRKLVRETYLELLNRPSDFGPGEDYWAGQLQNGLGHRELYERFILTEEFWDNAIIAGYVRNTQHAF
jgi:hypothetical protein